MPPTEPGDHDRLQPETARLVARLKEQEGPLMEYRTLGKTGLKVSVTGFGCWEMG